MLLSSHLSWHNFRICSCNFDTCIQASTIVSFNHVTSKHISSTNSTVVGSLWPREPTLWPAKRMTIFVKQRVFLFNTKPRMGVLTQMKKFKTVIKTLTHWIQKLENSISECELLEIQKSAGLFYASDFLWPQTYYPRPSLTRLQAEERENVPQRWWARKNVCRSQAI